MQRRFRFVDLQNILKYYIIIWLPPMLPNFQILWCEMITWTAILNKNEWIACSARWREISFGHFCVIQPTTAAATNRQKPVYSFMRFHEIRARETINASSVGLSAIWSMVMAFAGLWYEANVAPRCGLTENVAPKSNISANHIIFTRPIVQR